MKKNKYICIHCHFYQPPRENPWLEKVEKQKSAFPFHDWNERITYECYGPNGWARIVDDQNRVIDMIDNYSNISFNFGPTLASYLEKNESDVYERIIESDKNKNDLLNNSAIAQCYNHIIMPLANSLDKETQVIWGIKDFEMRFKRKPLGMWLPEGAVDFETLSIMKKHGIEFIILSPYSALRYRKTNANIWKNNINPRFPYHLNLPNNDHITVFFYDGDLSNEMAFKNILGNGTDFYNKLISSFSNDIGKKEFLIAAIDGETLGHHKKFADMSVAYSLEKIKKENEIDLINFENYLKLNPPEHVVEIIENSSWSCAHKVGRWSYDCGCNLENKPLWNQKWRFYLRNAMNYLRDDLFEIYFKNISKYLKDPVRARNEYINVINNRDKENIKKFLMNFELKTLNNDELTQVLKLLEMQRFAMSMFTSCGWFFDDLLRIESLQILTYAIRAIQLCKEVTNIDLESNFKKKLKDAKSNEGLNGEEILNEIIIPKALEIKKIAAFFIINLIFEKHNKNSTYFCYNIEIKSFEKHFFNKKHLVFGNIKIESQITLENISMNFAAIHFEDENFIIAFSEEEIDFKKIKDTFFQNDLKVLKELLLSNLFIHNFSFWDLLEEDQLRIINKILHNSLNEMSSSIENIYENHYSFLSHVRKNNLNLSKNVLKTLEFVFNQRIIDLLNEEFLNLHKIQTLVHEIIHWKFQIDERNIKHLLKINFEKILKEFQKDILKIEHLISLNKLSEIFTPFSWKYDFWDSQNKFFEIFEKDFREFQKKSLEKDEFAMKWLKNFERLQKNLNLKIF
jgi:alpha-amylase/alpha-mannosidase (GH57 family)